MAMTMTTALLLGSALAGGTRLASAKMGSKAAKDAAKIQSRAADEAMGFTRQAYGDMGRVLSPYLAGGGTAFNTISRLVAPPMGARYAATPPSMEQATTMGGLRRMRPASPPAFMTTGVGPGGPVRRPAPPGFLAGPGPTDQDDPRRVVRGPRTMGMLRRREPIIY